MTVYNQEAVELAAVRETETLITAQLALQLEIFVPSINAYND